MLLYSTLFIDASELELDPAISHLDSMSDLLEIQMVLSFVLLKIQERSISWKRFGEDLDPSLRNSQVARMLYV